MRKTLIPVSLAILSFLWSPVSLYAQPVLALQGAEGNVTRLRARINTHIPLVITRGFDALVEDGTKEAFEIWSNSSIPIIGTQISSIADMMKIQLDHMLGECIGYSVIDTISLTSKTQIIYVESQHDEGALFWRFTIHESPKKLVITSINVNSDPSTIMPIPNLNRH